MVRHAALFAIAGISLALGRDPGCGGVDGHEGSVNAPCTREKDCRGGLVCREGVCAELDGGPPTDAAPEGGGPKDASRDGA